MQTSTVFAAGSKTQRLTRKNLAEQVPEGTVAIAGGTLSVKPAQGEVRSFPVKDLSFMPSRITSSSTKTSR